MKNPTFVSDSEEGSEELEDQAVEENDQDILVFIAVYGNSNP